MAHHQPEYEDVKVRPSLQTRITFGEGLKSPAELFGSLKKAGQRFVGADRIVGSDKIPHRFTGKSANGKCQCRHHQKKLIDKSESDNHEIFPISEQTTSVPGDDMLVLPRGYVLPCFYLTSSYLLMFQLEARRLRSRTPWTATWCPPRQSRQSTPPLRVGSTRHTASLAATVALRRRMI